MDPLARILIHPGLQLLGNYYRETSCALSKPAAAPHSLLDGNIPKKYRLQNPKLPLHLLHHELPLRRQPSGYKLAVGATRVMAQSAKPKRVSRH